MGLTLDDHGLAMVLGAGAILAFLYITWQFIQANPFNYNLLTPTGPPTILPPTTPTPTPTPATTPPPASTPPASTTPTAAGSGASTAPSGVSGTLNVTVSPAQSARAFLF